MYLEKLKPKNVLCWEIITVVFVKHGDTECGREIASA